jgi:ABC-2 type transport system ATP-binding protein
MRRWLPLRLAHAAFPKLTAMLLLGLCASAVPSPAMLRSVPAGGRCCACHAHNNAAARLFESRVPSPESRKGIRVAPIIAIQQLTKTYAGGFQALKGIDLDIQRGEIFALLGPNGAGKTTLISVVCGLVTPSSGRVLADGHDIVHDYRAARAKIGLVPQELATDAFETVWATVRFSRGLFGKPKNPAYLEQVLRELSLWDKRDSKISTLSGGMKRRVLIAKALAHEPSILFLDEPTAGVDVALRHDMWQMVRRLREQGTTIILTTHYIEEAEDMADRVGVINRGALVLVEDKRTLMRKLGKKQLALTLQAPLPALPAALAAQPLELSADGAVLTYTYDVQAEQTGIGRLLRQLEQHGVQIKDLHSSESSLEEIFVNLVHPAAAGAQARA